MSALASNDTVYNYQTQCPASWAWIQDHAQTNDFVRSIRNHILQKGYLSGKQQACIARNMSQERVAAQPAPEVKSLDKLHAFFDKAAKTKLKAMKLHFEGFTAKLASAAGKNPGAIYLTTEISKRKDGPCVWGSGSNFTTEGVYLGKLASGHFFRARECTDEQATAIVATLLNPLEAAIAYGKRTGRCTVCHRKLTDPKSIEAGIGPICAEGFNP